MMEQGPRRYYFGGAPDALKLELCFFGCSSVLVLSFRSLVPFLVLVFAIPALVALLPPCWLVSVPFFEMPEASAGWHQSDAINAFSPAGFFLCL